MQLAFIGDSLTLGVNDPQRLGWTGRLCQKLDPLGKHITAYNLGVRASSTAHIEARWKNEVDNRIVAGNPALLIFCFGAPDAVRDLDFAQSLISAENILGNAGLNYPLLFLTPPPMIDPQKDSRGLILSEEFSKICAKLDIPCLDLNSSLRKKSAYIDELKKGDGVHPGAEGYGIMADLIKEFISPYILPHLK